MRTRWSCGSSTTISPSGPTETCQTTEKSSAIASSRRSSTSSQSASVESLSASSNRGGSSLVPAQAGRRWCPDQDDGRDASRVDPHNTAPDHSCVTVPSPGPSRHRDERPDRLTPSMGPVAALLQRWSARRRRAASRRRRGPRRRRMPADLHVSGPPCPGPSISGRKPRGSPEHDSPTGRRQLGMSRRVSSPITDAKYPTAANCGRVVALLRRDHHC